MGHAFVSALQPNPPDADELIRKAIANGLENGRIAGATFQEEWKNLTGTAAVQPKITTAKFQILFVDGIAFRRMTAQNGKALNGNELVQENRRYDETVSRYRKLSPEEKRAFLSRTSGLMVDPRKILQYQTCEVKRKRLIHNREATEISCTPKSGSSLPPNENRSVLNSEITLWIDVQDTILSSMRLHLIRDVGAYGPGTTITIECTKIGGVWHHTSTLSKWRGNKDNTLSYGETSEVYSNFQRFHVESKILPDFSMVPPGTSEIP